MTLTKWLDESGLTQAQAAEKFSVPLVTFRGWLYDGKVPTRERIDRIAEVTGGDITLKDWLEHEAKPKAANRLASMSALSPAAMTVLYYLEAKGCHVRELAAQTGLPAGSTRRAVAQLRQAGLVKRAVAHRPGWTEVSR